MGAAVLVGASAQAGATAPDPYSGSIETDCRISVPAVVEPGEKVVVTISVAANSPTPPTGEIDLSIKTRPGDDVVWRKTVAYDGGTQKVVGPRLGAGRDYTATSRFVPDDDTFAGCRASAAFAVDSQGDRNGPDDNDDNGPGGLLPDTGGPALLWLVLGVSLVGAGSATVVHARRRNAPSAA